MGGEVEFGLHACMIQKREAKGFFIGALKLSGPKTQSFLHIEQMHLS